MTGRIPIGTLCRIIRCPEAPCRVGELVTVVDHYRGEIAYRWRRATVDFAYLVEPDEDWGPYGPWALEEGELEPVAGLGPYLLSLRTREECH